MELAQRHRLSQLVEELTTSGQPQLNQDKMKEIKKICKISNNCIDHMYHLVMAQLGQEHSEIRLSAFQIASELFSRSHYFRTLLVDNFKGFLELTIETDSDQPLPPPKEVARKLRSLAIATMQSWQASYGTAYKKLALGYHFLKQVKKVDFHDTEARTVAERRREDERQRKLERIYRERVEAASRDMEESHQEIEATLTQMESCMRLLSPEFDLTDMQTMHNSTLDDEQPCCSKDLKSDRQEGGQPDVEKKFDKGQGNKGEEEKESCDEEGPYEEDLFIRNSGLISHAYNLDLNFTPGIHLKETEDNEAVVSTLIDLYRMITTKHLPVVQGWIQVFTKARAEQQLLRKALDLKRSLEAAQQKHNELHIDYKARVRRVVKASSDLEDNDDDNDFDEVPEKEGYEPNIPEHLRVEYGLDLSPSTSAATVTRKPPAKVAVPLPQSSSFASVGHLKQLTEEEQDPTCAAATFRLLRQNLPQPTTGPDGGSGCILKISQKSANAPVVPFGLDLYYWGQEQPNAGKIIKAASQHQFWVPCEVEEEVENEQLLAESRSRYISFPGIFIPVSHYCKAPLGDGRLCHRQDRLKCPFHGPIIPRDQEGLPCRQEDRVIEERREKRRREEQPDWRDTALMRDIEVTTGQNLGSDRVAKKGKGKKKFPNLSDLKQRANTPRSRLQRKVFNQSTVRRVAQVMSKADQKKHDKFSNQFNYALN
uniref:UV-stimulated scaffold protein A n=1 Tax=Echeneis naucrates TaxID=173247 RepID=A0A665VHK0_ECHNA